MNTMLNLEELIALAAKIELDGKKFYAQAADATENPEAKKLFLDLSNWEDTHYNTFKNLLNGTEKEEFDQIIDPMNEAALYLDAILGGKIFSQALSPEEISAENPQSLHNIFRFALDREKDSIIFYSSLEKVYVNDEITKKLDIIIGEEISHIRFLHEVRSKMLKDVD